ncbi:hypothetical protein FRB90_008361 [Tulasnella sp. 427]|nr:hypothetical protein FRB90_008361 [Tulasnella sp. 427]
MTEQVNTDPQREQHANPEGRENTVLQTIPDSQTLGTTPAPEGEGQTNAGSADPASRGATAVDSDRPSQTPAIGNEGDRDQSIARPAVATEPEWDGEPSNKGIVVNGSSEAKRSLPEDADPEPAPAESKRKRVKKLTRKQKLQAIDQKRRELDKRADHLKVKGHDIQIKRSDNAQEIRDAKATAAAQRHEIQNTPIQTMHISGKDANGGGMSHPGRGKVELPGAHRMLTDAEHDDVNFGDPLTETDDEEVVTGKSST